MKPRPRRSTRPSEGDAKGPALPSDRGFPARLLGALLLAAIGAGVGCAGSSYAGDPTGRNVPDPAQGAAPETLMAEPAPIPPGRAPPPGPYAPGIDVLHYGIELDLSARTDTIRGRTRIRLLRTDAAPGRVELDLTGLAVDTLRVGPVGGAGAGRGDVPPDRYRDALARGKLPVPFPEGSGPGDTLTVEVVYRGVPDDGLIVGRTVHGTPSIFADNWPNRARFWFPSVDHPSDKATVSFTVHAPEAWGVVANGVAAGDLEPAPPRPGHPEEARRTWRWETRVPIPTYTMVVGATEFAVETVGLAACGKAPESPRDDGCVEVTTWLYPPDASRAALSFRRAAEMVEIFTDLFGPFPYGKLANVQSSTRFGGMENVGAIFYSEQALSSGRDIEGTVAHEIAHQWFGDAVTEADWHHLWLSEGFATYFAAVFYEEADGEEAFRREMEGNRRRYFASGVTDRPVVDPEEDDLFALLNGNNYPKGAWVLHTLRGVMGDEAFFRGIREFYRRYRHATVLTEDLRGVMEEVSGRELGWFFEQWIHRPGYPVIETELAWDEETGEARIVLRQIQSDAWPTFRLPARLLVRLADGSERLVPVELRNRADTVRLSLPGPPEAAVFDPEGRVLHRKAGGDGA